MVKFVSACVERDKKVLKKWIFALTPLRVWSIFRRSTGVSRRSKVFEKLCETIENIRKMG